MAHRPSVTVRSDTAARGPRMSGSPSRRITAQCGRAGTACAAGYAWHGCLPVRSVCPCRGLSRVSESRPVIQCRTTSTSPRSCVTSLTVDRDPPPGYAG
eukprot:303078-Hanusia_phi.AAC.4